LLWCHDKVVCTERYADTPTNLPHYDPTNGSIQDAIGWTDPDYTKTNGFVNSDIPYNYYLLDDGYGGASSVLNNVCSPSCCNRQYETPTIKDVMGDQNQYVSSNMTCSGEHSGCICMTQQQQNYLENRGGNRT
jgi:hypothetical protein